MLRWAGLVARLVVGGVWIWAGAIKLPDPEASVTAVRAYQLLPPELADVVGRVLPMLEVVVGACLVLGLVTRVSAAVSAVLQVAFIVGIISVWSRGIEISCGCFGDGGPDPDAFGSTRGRSPATPVCCSCPCSWSGCGARRTPWTT